jgi:sec-independent protein translocase protein TatB
MLDNFGFGEFFFLALLALLFFGPERLPQIGAKIGQWIASLTQYSKAFMTEWSEEALAIRDAVEEVKGIRDEIAAAQAEIAGTLNTARNDVDGALSDARADVQQQIASVGTAAAPEATSPAPSAAPTVERSVDAATPDAAGSEDAAIAKTQQMLSDLKEKLAARQAQAAAPPEGDTDDAARDAPEKEDASTSDRDVALAETRQMLGDMRVKFAAHQATLSAPSSPATPPADSPAEQSHAAVRGPVDMERLRAQVDGLETGIRALREELAALRDLMRLRAGEPAAHAGDPA